MDAAEAAELIREVREDQKEDEEFRGRVALVISVMAAMLALANLGGGNVAEDMIRANIQASDTWAFYQAKNIRQTANNLAADALEAELAFHPAASVLTRDAMEQKAARYRSTAERYESEPDAAAPADSTRGEGKRELSARARHWEAQWEVAQQKDASFDMAEVLLQIAIVLGSVSILALSRPVLWISVALGTIATVLTVNGFLLFFVLPF